MDNSGNIYLTGNFGSAIDFGGAAPVTPHGVIDIFVAKYSANGSNLWVRSFGTNAPYGNSCVGNALAVDRRTGDVVVTGNFQATMSFGGPLINYNGTPQIFVAKYSGGNGSHIWSTNFVGAATELGSGLGIDNNGNISLTSKLLSRSLDFGSGGLAVVNGVFNDFIANLSMDGAPRWGKAFGVGYGNARGMAFTPSGNWLVTGTFTSSANFDCGTITSAGRSAMLLAEFAP
jgi:hypothetical protein